MTHEFCPDESGVCAQGKDSECPAMQPVPDGPKPGYCPTCGQYPQTPAPIASGDALEAARYRWLRQHFRFANDSVFELWFDATLSLPPLDDTTALDTAIDAARNTTNY